eukprot:TRINITY_DN66484_c0_g1_i1.p1 TRINITY_DN66484_c0_g1~~TRINITY_DN66484_c0_g1_i1.p1  ORF type:complete len:546 (-),score=175.09 TRINITY_DN66484_c0_g1_i1:160-1797(-)
MEQHRPNSSDDHEIFNGKPYTCIEVIGDGTYGIIYKAFDHNLNKVVALKKVVREYHKGSGIGSTVLREIMLLKRIKHENVVKLLDIKVFPIHIVMSFECLNCDLRQYSDQCKGQIPKESIKSILKGILRGIKVCHEKRIMHRDLKPQNILLDDNLCPKLCDFGLARVFFAKKQQFTAEVLTLWYRSPEVILKLGAYDCSIDIWSIGCIFAELSNGTALFPGNDESETLSMIVETLGFPCSAGWDDLQNQIFEKLGSSIMNLPGLDWTEICPNMCSTGLDLLQALLCWDPEDRLSAAQALSHPYFDDVHENCSCNTVSTSTAASYDEMVFEQQQMIYQQQQQQQQSHFSDYRIGIAEVPQQQHPHEENMEVGSYVGIHHQEEVSSDNKKYQQQKFDVVNNANIITTFQNFGNNEDYIDEDDDDDENMRIDVISKDYHANSIGRNVHKASLNQNQTEEDKSFYGPNLPPNGDHHEGTILINLNNNETSTKTNDDDDVKLLSTFEFQNNESSLQQQQQQQQPKQDHHQQPFHQKSFFAPSMHSAFTLN